MAHRICVISYRDMKHPEAGGAEVIINMAASPFHMGKAAMREELFARQAARLDLPIVYVNQVGGNDELVFDGSSCAVDRWLGLPVR